MYYSTAFSLLAIVSTANAMDMPGMSSGSNSGSMGAMMIPYLHFTGGDYLYFAGIAPTSNGAIAGACIALVVLAILERAVAGARGVLALKLAERRRNMAAQKQEASLVGPGLETPAVEKNKSDITCTPGSTIRSSPMSDLRPLPPQ
ncbi:hypothetical protein FS749_012635, partial [Ceratobasidium sp. UAMH 11750]